MLSMLLELLFLKDKDEGKFSTTLPDELNIFQIDALSLFSIVIGLDVAYKINVFYKPWFSKVAFIIFGPVSLNGMK